MEIKGTRIQSVSRAASLLRLLARRPGGCTATQAAQELGLTVPTAHHLLSTLAAEGLALKDSRRRFLLGPGVVALAAAVARQPMPEYLDEPLRELAERTEETAYLAAWDGGAIRVLASVEGALAVRVAEVERGPYRHAHARATGKLMLAFASPEERSAYLATNPLVPVTGKTITERNVLEDELAAIRRRGYAEEREEFVEGVCCLSAPLLFDDVLVAAFTVSAPAQRFARHRASLRASVLAAGAGGVESLTRDLRRSA